MTLILSRKVFGKRSLANLEFVHSTLRMVAVEALNIGAQDFTVICGFRDKAGQDAAIKAGTTKVAFPNSAHNQSPSLAIDVIPFPFLGWNDTAGFLRIAAQMFEAAKSLDVVIRWGGDFNRDGEKTKSDAWDKPHYELHPWREFRRAA